MIQPSRHAVSSFTPTLHVAKVQTETAWSWYKITRNGVSTCSPRPLNVGTFLCSVECQFKVLKEAPPALWCDELAALVWLYILTVKTDVKFASCVLILLNETETEGAYNQGCHFAWGKKQNIFFLQILCSYLFLTWTDWPTDSLTE